MKLPLNHFRNLFSIRLYHALVYFTFFIITKPYQQDIPGIVQKRLRIIPVFYLL